MSADVLREAAALMRELADAAEAQTAVTARVKGVWLNSRFYMTTTPERERAIADWLDEAADHLAVEDGDDDGLGHICPTAVEGLECSVLGQALAVAHAHLGTTPP